MEDRDRKFKKNFIRRKKRKSKKRKIEIGELKKILAEHKKWIHSNKKLGKRADLSKADLSNFDLSHTNLAGAIIDYSDLSNCNLTDSNCRGAILNNTDLSNANLRSADLSNANLQYADLRLAKLMPGIAERTDFSYANLQGSDLRFSLLMNSNFYGADLSLANLTYADLSDTDLRDTGFIKSTLLYTNFSSSDLRISEFRDADLSDANLEDVRFSRAKLKNCKLINANLSSVDFEDADLEKVDFSGANIFHINTHGWIIKNIKCSHVFCYKLFGEQKKEIKEKSLKKFKQGEFEEIYKKLPTVEYYFKNGFSPIDPIIMDKIVRTINKKHSEFELTLNSFHAGQTPRAIFTVTHKKNKEKALDQIKNNYEKQIKYLEGDRDRLLMMFQKSLENPTTLINIEKQISATNYFDKYTVNQNSIDEVLCKLKQELSEEQKQYIDEFKKALKENDKSTAQDIWDQIKEGVKTGGASAALLKIVSELLGFPF